MLSLEIQVHVLDHHPRHQIALHDRQYVVKAPPKKFSYHVDFDVKAPPKKWSVVEIFDGKAHRVTTPVGKFDTDSS